MFDLMSKVYVDATMQGKKGMNEHSALVSMVDQSNIPGKVIVLMDRGYESFNNIAHLQEKEWNFIIRAKESYGMISNLQLPNSEEFDVDTTLTLMRRQTKETLALLSAYPERYRWIQPHTTFDYIAPKAPNMYDLRFRVVRFQIPGGYYETVYTNLDPETFPIERIKELYCLRWGIETSFRELKYTIGLACLHGKKTDFLLQEVFARLILYNYASLVARQIPAPQGKQINFSVAILACKQFLKGKIESTQIFEIEGVHATLCSILSDAVEGGFLSHNPAWRTYRYAGRKCEKKIADEETAQKIIAALEGESIKYETYFKLIIATGMRRDECCGLKWCDIDWEQRSIHICRNAVKVTDEEIFVKEPKTRTGNRYVYFSAEMESLLREYRQECAYLTETYDQRQLTTDDFLFRLQGAQLPMTPTTFTYRFKLILKKNGLPRELNVHSLRHTAASLMIAGGTDVATVAGILGHSQPSTTLDIYTHAFDKNKKAASAGLQEMLEI